MDTNERADLNTSRPKVAAIMTEYRPISHADVIIGRLLGDWGYQPRIDIVSMYTDQVPENDMSRDKSAEHGIPIYDTIGEAIAAGGERIDGVIIIGEHGDYPWNEKNQKMYPRRRLIEQSLEAMDALNLRVPLFNDKHLSYNTKDTVWIYEALIDRGIPFFGGSSISLTDRSPNHDVSVFHDIEEMVIASYGEVEAYGYHALEVMQSIAEQRQGGETGIAYVEAMEGQDVWTAADRGEWPEHLLNEALEFPFKTSDGNVRDIVTHPVLFRVQYESGLTGYVINLRKYINAWSFACRKQSGETVSALCRSLRESEYPHFDDLTEHIEQLILTGRSPIPPERVFVTSVLIDAAMNALFDGRRVLTPELTVQYGG